MKKSGLSQETLKIIACVTMLIDHVGATVVESQFLVTPSDGIYYLYFAMRIIGRVAFPIYCFLLAEGAHYTHDPRKYALRLFIGALLSEPGFDFALFAMIPICLYSGRKATASRGVQLGFYLFYPVHLAVLAVIMKLCFGG